MARKLMQVWHPDSPGVTIWVARGWWERLFYPKEFATIAEVIRWRGLGETIDYHEKRVDIKRDIVEDRFVDYATLSRHTDDDPSNPSPKDKFVLPG